MILTQGDARGWSRTSRTGAHAGTAGDGAKASGAQCWTSGKVEGEDAADHQSKPCTGRWRLGTGLGPWEAESCREVISWRVTASAGQAWGPEKPKEGRLQEPVLGETGTGGRPHTQVTKGLNHRGGLGMKPTDSMKIHKFCAFEQENCSESYSRVADEAGSTTIIWSLDGLTKLITTSSWGREKGARSAAAPAGNKPEGGPFSSISTGSCPGGDGGKAAGHAWPPSVHQVSGARPGWKEADVKDSRDPALAAATQTHLD